MSTDRVSSRPSRRHYGVAGKARFVARFVAMFVVIYGLLVGFWIVRAIEWPFGRPISPHITSLVCRSCLFILGIELRLTGQQMRRPGGVVANHSSWLDIFVLNAVQQVCFVSKAEVRSWLGIGILARSTGTVFIERQMRHARAQRAVLTQRLEQGDKLLIFPEGTSTDGLNVLPFKSALFSAFFDPSIHSKMFIQPISVSYHSPLGEPTDFFSWFGDMDMFPHLAKVLAAPGGGHVDVLFHEPLPARGFSGRKELAQHCENIVRTGMTPRPAA